MRWCIVLSIPASHDMTDRAEFGLALGGGFLHGLAHLGVMGVLEEHELTPGWITGTSAGAIAAAFTAFGVSTDEVQPALAELSWASLTRTHLFNPLGFATNEGLEDILVGALGDVCIEDSQIPFAVVATDINTGARVLLDHGPLVPAVRASCCVPGVYAPVEVEGRLLVDGALVENVPARAVRDLGAPLVVAVGFGIALPFQPVESWRQVMSNAFDIAANVQMRSEILAEVDVLIDPDVTGLSKMRGKDREGIIEAGRRRAEEALPALQELLKKEETDAVSRWMSAVKERLMGRDD